MSYTIDFYLGKVASGAKLPFRFATFVCVFPQLMAGPIESEPNKCFRNCRSRLPEA